LSSKPRTLVFVKEFFARRPFKYSPIPPVITPSSTKTTP